MDQKLIDKDGSWVLNTGAYPFTDPTSGVTFDSGVAYKVKLTDWLKSQPVFKAFDPETGETSELAPVEADAEVDVEAKAPATLAEKLAAAKA